MSRIASRLSSLVPVHAVRAVSDEVRQLYSLELEEHTGVRLRANSISDGTLRFLALTAIAEATGATGVYCMEEPENGIHPEKLAAMNQLLHDIAVDLDERVASDNPLRQVIVATHSPYFVQLQSQEELVIANNPAVRSAGGQAIWPLKCYPLAGTWRIRSQQEDEPVARGLGKAGVAVVSDAAGGCTAQIPGRNSGRERGWTVNAAIGCEQGALDGAGSWLEGVPGDHYAEEGSALGDPLFGRKLTVPLPYSGWTGIC